MKVTHAENNVLGSEGLGETKSFQIRTNAHAFRMLSSGLYSDKIAAVLREIGCNAHDAHIAAGKANTPFQVKLPNAIDEQFYIKDFGTGLSYDDVMSLYTTYFASTKQNSDDFTGGFGLGSKSPFSYTDSFTIVSRHGGKAMTFSAHIGNDGSPNIAMMHEEPADDTGMTISFPVKHSEHRTFATKAQEIFKYFSVLPEVKGGEAIKAAEWKFHKGYYAQPVGTDGYASIIMGNVRYPLNISQLHSTNSVIADAFGYHRFTLLVPIGTCKVAASREAIEYDPTTCKNLVAILERIARDEYNDIEASLGIVGKTWKEKCEYQNKLKTVGTLFSTSTEMYRRYGSGKHPALAKESRYDYLTFPANTIDKEQYTAAQWKVSHRHANGPRITKEDFAGNTNVYLEYKADLKVVYGVEVCAAQRIRAAMLDGTLPEHVIVVFPKPGNPTGVTNADVKALVDNVIISATGTMDFVEMSTLPKPPSKPAMKHPKGVFPDGEVRHTLEGTSMLASTLPATTRVYCRFAHNSSWGRERPSAFIGDVEYTSYDFERIIAYLHNLKGFITPFEYVFVSHTNMTKMRMHKNPEWTSFKDALRKTLLDPAVMAKLEAAAKNYIPRIDPDEHVKGDALHAFLYLKQTQPMAYALAEPLLKKQKVYDVIETVAAVRKANTSKLPEALEAYERLITKIAVPGEVLTAPKIVKAVLKTEHVSQKLGNVNGHILEKIYTVSPAAFTTIINERLA